MNNGRRAYLDNIRWATVLLVMVYHVFYLFNGVGILGGIPGAESIPVFDQLACMIYPWFMVLLFAVAGMSARYALQKRTGKQFVRERAAKLLVPSTLGLFALHWVTGYLNIKLGGGLAYIPPWLLYPLAALSGTGPLWFIQLLFLFSCILVLCRRLDPADKLWAFCGKAGLPALLLLSGLVFGAAQVLNLPVFTMYRFGIYFAAFLIGYYVFSHDEVQEILAKNRFLTGGLAAAGAVFYGARYAGQNFTAPACLQSLCTNLYLWAVVLAVLGWGKACFDRETPFTRRMTRASFGLYILHYPVLLAGGYLLHSCFALPAVVNYAAALVLEAVGTPVLYAAVRRVPLLRYLVLGSKAP